nr:hypothetical protein [Tanacetum cinerariifolium]
MEKASSQPQSSYEAAATLTEFELKKILIDKMNSSESYLTASKHRECYDGLIKSYNLDKVFFSSYDVYSLKQPTISPKTKDSSSKSSKGTKSQPKSSGKSVHVEEPEFEVGDTDTPQGQEGNQGPAFKLLKGTCSNYAELEYDFEECYKALSEKLDWENPEGGDYPFDLSKPLPLITHGNRQSVPVEFFINNDLKYLQGGISTMTYTTSTTKTKAAQYDLSGIEDMNRLKNLLRDDVADFAIALRMFTGSLRNRLMRSDELYKFSDGTLTRLLSSLEDITKNIDMEYLPKRRWSTLEKKRAHYMIKDIIKLLKERRMMRSLEKFISGRLYETDLRLLQRAI